MTTAERIDATSLPPVVRTLLDLFRDVHPAADAHLVRGTDSDELRAHGAAPVPALDYHWLGEIDDDALRLCVCRDGAPPADVKRIVEALSSAFTHEREARSTAQELSDRYEEINLLYSISEILGSVRSFEEGARHILTEVMDVLSARRASLWVFREESSALELVAAVGEDGLSGPIDLGASESATAWVFREKQPMNVEREPHAGSQPGRPRTRGGEAFLSVPIHYTPPDGTTRTLGVLTLIGRRGGDRFTSGDERLLSAIASQVGAAIEAHRLLEESVRQERVLRELELAHNLQLKLLPAPDTFEPPPEIAARCVPADSVGGDFYQLYRLSGDRLGLLIGDVSSHGFPAALIMALTMSAIGIYAKEEEAPAEVLRRVHRALIRELESTEMYLSLFYGVLDLGSGQLDYANAGHPQAYRIDGEGRMARLGATGPPLGVTPVEPYGARSVRWGPADVLVLFTDGLSDALANRLGSADGEVRLVRHVLEHRNEPLEAVMDAIFSAADQPGDAPPDDRTLLILRS